MAGGAAAPAGRATALAGRRLAAAATGLLSPEEQSLVLTRTGRTKRWTPADQVLLDAANTFLNGPPATVGHVVVDEAQDLSALALRTVAHRCPSGSLTILGDLAQSTGAAGQSSWDDVIDHLGVAESARVEQLTIGYRVPAPILDVANRLLPSTGVTVSASRSVRREGHGPAVRRSADPAAAAGGEVVALRRHHRLTGVVAATRWHAALSEALTELDLRAVGHVQQLADDEVPVFDYEEVKGLELDGVVVVEPGEVLDGSARGARLVYVALTRAVQELTIVCSGPLPDVLRPAVPATVPPMSERPVDSEDHREPVIVATFVDIGEAEIAQAKLRAFGIESAVLNQAEGGTIPTVELPLGIGLEVKAADADDAFRILSDT